MKKNIIEKLKKELKKSKEESEKYLNGWKRAKADYINRDRRIEAERIEWINFSNQKIILKILPILDSFHQSLGHISKDMKNTEWVAGILQIKKQLENLLKEEGVERIKTVGEKFNPMLHEVVGKENSKEELENVITKEIQRGYVMHGKVIRPAKVIIK